MKRVLIAGYGDIARRASALRPAEMSFRPLGRRSGEDLDRPPTLSRIAGWADCVLHLAPPPDSGEADTRSAHLLAALEGGALPGRFVYASTSGVYGDCAGAWVDEDRPPQPGTARGLRRLDAERRIAAWCAAHGVALVILRVPGIYAADRLPLARLRAGMPVLREADDVHTNHIHAEDLARICLRALDADAPAGIYNASDDSELKMGAWYDLLADTVGCPRPPRIPRAEAAARIPAASLSFMSESRRLVNRRLKEVLGYRLRYPRVDDGLRDLRPDPGNGRDAP
jgi:nucleoside-diphosphate-sugar epimerase